VLILLYYFRAALSIRPFQADFYRKERKDLKEKHLCRFFSAIFAFFVVQCSIVAALLRCAFLSLFAANQHKFLSTNHLHLITRRHPSGPIVPNQAKSCQFFIPGSQFNESQARADQGKSGNFFGANMPTNKE
jgi:hypothetical protein